jgi:trk system potassium uptake protein TrkA
MAMRLANRLLTSRVMDYITLNDDITITELRLTSKLAGQTVQQASLRKKYKLNIIAVQHDDKTTTDISPETLLSENDILVVVGKKEHIRRFEGFLTGGR